MKLHPGMDAAGYQIAPGFRKSHFHGFAGLLRAGIEIELGIEHADVVGARVVARRRMFARDGKSTEYDLVSKSLANLLRMWVED